MPSLRMKTKLGKESLRDNNGLHVCKKSTLISKNSYSQDRVSQVTADSDWCNHDCHPDSSSAELSARNFETNNEAIGMVDEETFQFQLQAFAFVDSAAMGIMESTRSCTSDLETIFSPALEPTKLHGGANKGIETRLGGCSDLSQLRGDETNENRSSCSDQSCNVSDFFISDMIVANIPFDKSRSDADPAETNSFSDSICAEPSMLYDMTEQYIILPFLEDQMSNKDSLEGSMVYRDNISLYPVEETRSSNEDPHENFDPRFIKHMPELSDMVSNFLPGVLPKEKKKTNAVTLVLDLDETLVHSTLEHSDDVDFTFTVFFNMKEHTVYVKQRPHLQTFLERVAEMFEVVIFTASQSIYAAKLLDILDPDGKVITRRMFRESCIFTDGGYTKDLTVIGVDLAKVAIIDNSPQVFRLQVNNGIPIKSWFDDPSDNALISLLPFLETLVDADDVRPIIAKRFGKRE